ncbi:MAG: DNA-directed RNA polymerase subunit beta [Candidatus Omnitrophica bacterium CG07_land_8_20_14_0_80_42_15]|uniref:DNA-directed RNA polymerase subunit beta n=1 Tax=Candidatus Aquitaenariimonas noxiae TaxID=1974741 RepID=A0A2J0KT54_9BACT|nr:MAG: DNA-directed RNA polymerase subunit beta [Candidatus Omnitrophica bacterium CG07_land_8_20_14_0_80_42_15]
MISRRNFGKLKENFEIPHLLEMQFNSYADFLQSDVPKTRRENKGLEEALRSTFPIESQDGNYKLEYVNYTTGKPKYSIPECRKQGMSYAAPLRIKLRLKSKKDTKEQEVYMGDVPLMTPTGTFVINGDERVVVSQLHRSPGVSFEASLHPSGKKVFAARLIPYRGAWIEFEFDINDVLYVYIDRRRKFLAATFLRILGYSQDKDILKAFDELETVDLTRSAQLDDYIGKILANDVVKKETNEVIVQKYEKLTKEHARTIWDSGVRNIEVIRGVVPEILKSIEKDKTKTRDEALIDIYRRLRPGDPPSLEVAETLINRLFFDPKRYDLDTVGRFMLNRKLGMNAPLSSRSLTPETAIEAIKKLAKIKNGDGSIDDIDHLGNRRVRCVGELLQNQIRIGLVRMERAARERMNIYNLENIMPHSLINSKLISGSIRDFFGRSQLSQFMDQTNPLAELTHKRRLSALGPGGLNRERAGFEVRDVHYSHYGRLCPIETPEGPNIGLISSLSTFAKINKFGFLETPYKVVNNGVVAEKIEYLTADIEDQYFIAQANASVDEKGRLVDDEVFCRYGRDFVKIEPKKVQYMDVSPKQLVSIAASLIPFLEHDDANRALMGSNMQRQAVPLLNTEAPLVGTGMEHKTVKDSGAPVVAEVSGKVTAVQANEIVVEGKKYPLRKFEKSNANTSINQRPIVSLGDEVKAGQIIADGSATKNGELALGKNVLVAFMPWLGYNFEDAIVVSEKIVKEDVYTSVHIEEFEVEARETRLGNEEITRDIPNIGEELLNNLDERGIIRIGAEVIPGDILVGKIAPKSETELSPEEKLLRAIFGEKAGDVKDASLAVPPGIEGIVIDVKVFSRKEPKGKTKEEKTKELKEIQEVRKYYGQQIERIKKDRAQKLARLLVGQKVGISLLDDESREVLIPQNKVIGKRDLKNLYKCDLNDVKLADAPDVEAEVRQIVRILDDEMENLSYEEEREVDRIKRGDELPPGVLKKIVVYVASRRKLSVGDKMAGRHGNKGVIARIVPEEDMPYLPDGTPVEIVLNPLGVPSRMNIGQILETHLGWAAQILGFSVATPVFDGIKENEIKKLMKEAGLPEDGKIKLSDGRTGHPFDVPVTVGYIYMMKLIHLVDDKIHARSIGPYSLVTQQPLGGKAQFGGQRFGEMEVWAFEAYGAAYTLQELLTVKSDDVVGRTRIYESIVKGEQALHCGTPESFNVLVKELQSLCLDVRMEKVSESGVITPFSQKERDEKDRKEEREKKKPRITVS